jgi:hypothetical protein
VGDIVRYISSTNARLSVGKLGTSKRLGSLTVGTAYQIDIVTKISKICGSDSSNSTSHAMTSNNNLIRWMGFVGFGKTLNDEHLCHLPLPHESRVDSTSIENVGCRLPFAEISRISICIGVDGEYILKADRSLERNHNGFSSVIDGYEARNVA